jgi:hypothetical protein
MSDTMKIENEQEHVLETGAKRGLNADVFDIDGVESRTINKAVNNNSDKFPVGISKSGRTSFHSRRNFLRTSLAAASAIFLGPNVTGCALRLVAGEADSNTESCIDYGRSFVCNTLEANSVRMWIESRTTIIDPKSGTSTVYYQCASCKSENTFAKKDLFIKDNWDFLPIFGDGKVLIFRRHVSKRGEDYRTRYKMEELWGIPVFYLPAAEAITELDTWEKIRDATKAGYPIVTRTEIQDPDTGLRAVIECPCKTMNISHPMKLYQVDTGPVAFPDLSKRYDIQMDCLNLAFIAFNSPHFADFVIEAPTPILDAGKEVATVYHYSKMVTLNAKNRILACGKVV